MDGWVYRAQFLAMYWWKGKWANSVWENWLCVYSIHAFQLKSIPLSINALIWWQTANKYLIIFECAII